MKKETKGPVCKKGLLPKVFKEGCVRWKNDIVVGTAKESTDDAYAEVLYGRVVSYDESGYGDIQIKFFINFKADTVSRYVDKNSSHSETALALKRSLSSGSNVILVLDSDEYVRLVRETLD